MSRAITSKTMAGLIAAGLAGGGAYMAARDEAPPPPPEKRITYQPRAAEARSWGGLKADELAALQGRLRGLGGERVNIFCQGSFCRELAEDLDEAFESSGFDSYLELPLIDIGKGIGISPKSDKTAAIAGAIRDATGGRIKLPVLDVPKLKGADGKETLAPIAIAIGRVPLAPKK